MERKRTARIGMLFVVVCGLVLTGCPRNNYVPTAPAPPTATQTPVLTNTPPATTTPTSTVTGTASSTPTATPSLSPTNTGIPVATFTPTATPSRTLTGTSTWSPTAIRTNTPTITVTQTFTWTPTATPSFTPTPTGSWYTSTPTSTPTDTGTFTYTDTPTITFTPTVTFTPTDTFTPNATATACVFLSFGNNLTSTGFGGPWVNTMYLQRYQATTSMTLYSASAYVWGSRYQAAIYSDNGSGTTPVNLLGEVSAQPVTASGWNSAPLLVPVHINAGTYYWMGVITDGGWGINFSNPPLRSGVAGVTIGSMPTSFVPMTTTCCTDFCFYASGCPDVAVTYTPVFTPSWTPTTTPTVTGTWPTVTPTPTPTNTIPPTPTPT